MAQTPPLLEQSAPLFNLFALSADELNSLIEELGWPRYRTIQILRWLYQNRVSSIDVMTNLSKSHRAKLQEIATVHHLLSPPPTKADDGTGKFVVNLEDGLAVETILIPEGQRRTLCLSSQVGCTLDCGFCLTAEMGLKRSLRAHEIVGQVLNAQTYLSKGERLSSLVFMGMGEPLINFEPLAEAIQRLTNMEWGLGFAPRRITVSTAGWIPRFPDVRRLGVNLAISLNATINEQRSRLMPAVNGRYDLAQLIDACRDYTEFCERPLTFEYVLLAGVNDSPEDAKRLVKLLQGIRCKVNLIPFNEFPGTVFRRPEAAVIDLFQGIIRSKGLDVFLRKSRGGDVLGACGQLGRSASEVLSPTGSNRKRKNALYAQF